MKKKLLLLFLPILLLTGCNNSSGGALPEKDRETVTLTANNYSKYIAVFTITDSYGAGNYSYSIYRYQFVGSTICKFNDCSITYCFTKDNGAEQEAQYTTHLTISGYGETEQVDFAHANTDYTYYHLKIKAVNGTVEVLY